MELDARLHAVAGLVLPGGLVADIGTDHAYLPAYLVTERICEGAIATDCAEGPCRSARRLIAQLGLADRIAVRLGNGLHALAPGEADTVVLAGMGGRLIVDILSASPAVTAAARRLVLQPQKNIDLLRRFLCRQGWRIVAERVAQEGGFYYPVIAAEQGRMQLSAREAQYGPCLLRERPPLFLAMLQRRLDEVNGLLAHLAAGESEKAAARRGVLQAEAAELMAILTEQRSDITE